MSAIECGLKNVLSAVPVDDPDIAGAVGLVVDCSGHEQAVLGRLQCPSARRAKWSLLATPWRRYTEMYAHTILHAIFHKYVVVRSGWGVGTAEPADGVPHEQYLWQPRRGG